MTNPLLEKEVEAFDEIAKNGRYSDYVVDRFCCGGDYCMGDHNGWIRDYFTQALERVYEAGKQAEPFMLVTNKFGNAYIYTDKDTFDGAGTFEEWRAEVAKEFDPNQTQP